MERVIQRVERFREKCQHNKFIIDPELNTVECGICGEKLNPIWCLEQFCDKESRIRQAYARAKKLVELTSQKTKCKCKHCGKITPIANPQESSKAFNEGF